VYRAVIERHTSVAQDLAARTEALEKADYQVQVKIGSRSTPLFVEKDGKRLPLSTDADGFVFAGERLSQTQAAALVEKTPEHVSANVLLRPVVQDFLLGSAACVVGPAEIAYFAQASVVYRRLGVAMPVVLPRAGFTLVEPHMARLLNKFHLEFSDLWQPEVELRKKLERDLIPAALTRHFDSGEETLRKLLEELKAPIEQLDPTLTGSLENAESKMLYQFTRLRERVARSISLRSAVLESKERALTELLYPHGGLQERALCLVPFLSVHGLALLDLISQRIQPVASEHCILYL
jgi:uncharacterized protein YllA (UPF0747 family)